jgi:O-acetyl-ADP-ribose deacetylase (regulator of RNase III)
MIKIEYRKGDLLSVTAGAILHGCNAQGVMASGVALAIKNKYPLAHEYYKRDLAFMREPLGKISRYNVTRSLTIVNGITQDKFGREPGNRYLNYGALASVIRRTSVYCVDVGQPEFHIPKIGAGLAQGDWEIISEIIEQVSEVGVVCWEL